MNTGRGQSPRPFSAQIQQPSIAENSSLAMHGRSIHRGQSEKFRRRLTTSAFEDSSDMIAKTICHWASVTPEIGQ